MSGQGNWGGTWRYTGADLKKESYSIMDLRKNTSPHISGKMQKICFRGFCEFVKIV